MKKMLIVLALVSGISAIATDVITSVKNDSVVVVQDYAKSKVESISNSATDSVNKIVVLGANAYPQKYIAVFQAQAESNPVRTILFIMIMAIGLEKAVCYVYDMLFGEDDLDFDLE